MVQVGWILITAMIGLCMVGMFRHAYRGGFDLGMQQGAMSMLRDVAEGHIRVEGDKLIFDGAHAGFFTVDGNEELRELDLDKLRFE